MSLTAAQREALGQTAYTAWCRSALTNPANVRTTDAVILWDQHSEVVRECWRCAAETAATTYASEMLPTEPPTRPDLPRRATPAPFRAADVAAILEEGKKP